MRICLLTTGQPSTNPRLVKEADALVEAGYQVRVLYGHWVDWADKVDKLLLANRTWSAQRVGGHPRDKSLVYQLTRLRHRLSLRMLAHLPNNCLLQRLALARVGPELRRAALATPADLYLTHYPAALYAAAPAAQKYNACLGYDAEDFYSGATTIGQTQSPYSRTVEQVERKFLSCCDFVTAASPGIASSYSFKYDISRPIPILNVFPLVQRPDAFRPGNPDRPLTLYWFSQTIGSGRGLEDVVMAMGLLTDLDIELHLRGNWQSGYQAELRRTAAEAGVTQKRIIVHAPAPSDEMPRLASTFDVGLALEPGRDLNNQITVSNKLFTYLLAGNAIVATNTPGQRTIMVEVNGAGYCYTAGDVTELAKQLRCWYEDRQSLEQARLAAWRWGGGRFNWDFEKERFLELINTLLPAGDDRALSVPSRIEELSR